MGDRTWVRLEFPESQLELFKKHFPYVEEDDQFSVEKGIVEVIMQEVNYGGSSELEEISKEGGVFLGGAGPGMDYGEVAFASDGSSHHDIGASEGDPVICVGDDDIVSAHMLKGVRLYRRVAAGAGAILNWIRNQEKHLTRRRRATDSLEGIHMLKIEGWTPVFEQSEDGSKEVTMLAGETDTHEVFSVKNMVFKRIVSAEHVSIGYDMARFIAVVNLETGEVNVIPKEQEVTVCSKVILSDEVHDGG